MIRCLGPVLLGLLFMVGCQSGGQPQTTRREPITTGRAPSASTARPAPVTVPDRSVASNERLRKQLDEKERTIQSLQLELLAERTKVSPDAGRVEEFLLKALDARDPQKGHDILLAALQMPYPRVRVYAAGELGRLNVPEAIAPFADLALTDPVSEVRLICVNTLGRNAPGQSVSVLVRALGDSDPEVAAGAAGGLGRSGQPAAVIPLIEVSGSEFVSLRLAAVQSLGLLGDTGAVATLVELLKQDPAIEVREQAAKSLGLLKGDQAVEALRVALDVSQPSLRVYVVDALGDARDRGVVGRLADLLLTDENTGVRESAAVALGKIGDPAACPALRKVLAEGDDKARQLVFGAFLTICSQDLDLLTRSAEELMTEGDFGHAARLLETLLVQVADKPEHQRLSVLARTNLADCYLKTEQFAAAVKLLEPLKQADPGNTVHLERYAQALAGQHKWPEAFRQYCDLSRALQDPGRRFWTERLSILDALIMEKNYAQAVELIADVKDKELDVSPEVRDRLETLRLTCQKQLQVQASDNALLAAKLVAELGSPESSVRELAATRLREMGRDAYPALVEGLASSDPTIRQAAFEILRTVTRQTFDYRPDGTEEQRNRALDGWRNWLKTSVGDRVGD